MARALASITPSMPWLKANIEIIVTATMETMGVRLLRVSFNGLLLHDRYSFVRAQLSPRTRLPD